MNKIISALQPRLKQLFIAYISLVFLLSVIPLNSSSANTYTIIIRSDYLIHLLLFLPFPVFIWLFVEANHKKSFLSILLWLVFGFCFAIICEGMQLIVPYRVFNINDLAANLSGILLGCLIFLVKRKVRIIS